MQNTLATQPGPEAAADQLRSSTEHPVMPIRFELLVRDRRLQGNGLSLTGGTCQGLLDPSLDSSRQLAVLRFPFNGFSISLPAEIALRVHDGSEQGEIGFTFQEPAGSHLPQLRFVLNSYIAGDLVQIADVLQVNTHTRVKPERSDARRGLGFYAAQSLRYAAVAALSFGLVAIAVSTVQARVLTRAEAHPAVVTLSGATLRAPASGQIDYVNPDATEGDVAFSLLATTGATLSIRMPCDCRIGDTVEEGATILAGEPVLKLLAEGGSPEIRATLSPEGLRAVIEGDTIELTFADGSQMHATLGPAAAAELAVAPPGDAYPVALTPESPLPMERAGQLATVRIVRELPLLGGIFNRLGSVFGA
ncbi:hypothetical protein [Tropicimonas aquimaris]|uniref:PilZ domain-containing protein n=1 Tax=Tropicimonas aquimaris TaxID=914152 RepID=A0ABW3IK10_9RHOB